MNKRSEHGKSMRRAWLFPLLAAVLATLGALVAAELGLRAFHAVRGTYHLRDEAVEARRNSIWKRSEDPVLIYVHRPDYWKEGIRYTEAHGILRPGDVSPRKSRDSIRILLLGDSIGAGLTVSYEERFSSVLEEMLAGSVNGSAEVINLSVNGYKTVQEARLLETVAGEFETDLILVAYCMNDVANSFTPTVWFLDPSPPRSYLWEEISQGLGLGRVERSQYVPVFGPHYGPHRYWHELYDPRSEGWGSVEEGFDRVALCASQCAAPVLLVVFPFFLPDDWYQGGVEPLHRQVARAAEARGFEVLDLLPVFAEYDVDEMRDDPDDLFHPNARGHRVAAEAVHARVLEIMGK
ncbi:MAG: SGNH/GDSL hydrolase family protein [Candidatus Eisenbacteria sp.]|nr:SGNH/GDSL hydrolase family protein [Candidatus Eisenbacteria bacterium]